MADDILKNTLPTLPTGFSAPVMKDIPTPTNYNKIGNTTKIHDENIRTLQGAQANESQLRSFQQIMSLGSRQAYKERQAQELGGIKNQFDPTKVSGGTFANIIGSLEQERGKDVSKIHGANFGAYREVQAEINKRLEYLQDLREKKRQYMTDYKYGKLADKKLLTGGGTAKKQRKDEKENFNREYILALQRAGNDTAYINFEPAQIRQSVQELVNMGHSYEDIETALNAEGIPTFPGSSAEQQLNLSFT